MSLSDDLRAAKGLTGDQRALLTLLAGQWLGLLNHDDRRLQRFCDPRAPLDVFNECHSFGWLRTTHDPDSSISIVRITDAGRRAIAAAETTALRGHNLACWCPLGSPCHADVLLELANRP